MTEQDARTEPGRRTRAVAAIVLGLVLYVFTCAPGVLWQDSAMFQFRVWNGDLAGDLGLPLAHPLYILLAKVFTLLPLGEFAYRVNLFSALCGAAALGIAIDLLLTLTRSRIAAITGTILLAVSHTFWTHAVMAEVYNLYALALLAELWLLERFFSRRRAAWLVLALLVNGLNVSNHLLAILHLPAYAGICAWALRRRHLRPRQLPLLAAACVAGASPYLYLIFREIAGGEPILQTFIHALLGPPDRAAKVVNLSVPFTRQVIRTLEYFALNFPTPLALLAPAGLWLAWKRPEARWFALVGGWIFAAGFLFAFRYPVADQYVFFMPCYVMFALFVAVGVAVFLSRSPLRCRMSVALALLPAAVYEAAPAVSERCGVSIGAQRHIPFRNTYTYFLRPRKNGETSAEQFARAALTQAAPDGLLIADTTIKNVLVYVRDVQGLNRNVVLHQGRDTTPAPPVVAISPETVDPFAKRRAAFICSDVPSYMPKWIPERFDIIPSWPVFRLEARSAAGSG